MGLAIKVYDEKGKRVVNRDAKKTEKELALNTIPITIATAQEALREEQLRGFDDAPRIRVDNVFDRPLQQVHSYGKVEYYAKQSFTEAILSIYDRLMVLSPVGNTRYYIGTHLVMLNGKTIARDKGELTNWLKIAQFRQGDVMHFVNAMPYARKLELNATRKVLTGKNKGAYADKRMGASARNKNIQVRKPNGAYFNTYRFARNNYKSIASFIKFQFISGAVLGLADKPIRPRQPNGAPFGTRFAKDGRPYVYPAIVLDFNSAGAI